MVTKPIVIMPFILIAFLECAALELIYFSTRSPISYLANPVIRKFFGEAFTHYPAHLIILPKLFYYAQVAIYMFIGVFLTGVAVNIFKNLTMNLPVRTKALIKNALGNYLSFFVYAVLVTALFFFLRKAELYIFVKAFNKIARLLPVSIPGVFNILIIILIFATNIMFQTLVISTVPLIVLEKMGLFKAFIKSVYLGARNFFTVFILIFIPFLIYFPVAFVKNFSTEIAGKTFPEINLLISIAGILLSILLDCFSLMCVSRFLLDRALVKKV